MMLNTILNILIYVNVMIHHTVLYKNGTFFCTTPCMSYFYICKTSEIDNGKVQAHVSSFLSNKTQPKLKIRGLKFSLIYAKDEGYPSPAGSWT